MAIFSLAGRCEGPEDGWLAIWPEGKMPAIEGCTATNGYPAVKFFMPEKLETKALMLIIPGGGYNHWSYNPSDYSGYFNSKGMAAAVLRYRVPRPPKGVAPKHVPAWQDAQRAIRFIRSRAPEMGLDPDRIGVLGMSAGGHLGLMIATSSQTPAYPKIDELDSIPCRVAWAAIVYPAYVLSDGADGPNSKETRGNDLSLKVSDCFNFDGDTPPMCLFHGDDDKYSAMGSVRIYHCLREAGIPAELHIFAKKGHVFNRNVKPGEPAYAWKEMLWNWLDFMDF